MLNAERGTNMTLKELLGDAWKDGMTVEDIETALKDVTLPADQSQEIASLKETISKKECQVRQLEDYIDNLLVRVMEETPNILRVPSQVGKKAGKM